MRYEQVVLESRPCPLGCPVNDEHVLTGRDRLHGLPGEFQVVRCRSCGLMRTNPRPTQETMAFYYPEDYDPYERTRVIPSDNESELRKALRSLARRVIKLHLDDLPPLPPGRMLEIGCASGAFMHRMAQQGWEVEGIEFSAKAAEAARSLGYVVHTGALEEAHAPARPYDLIVGWMVLEHLHEPVQALRKLHSWATPGAWLAISVPDANAWEFSIFQDAWHGLHLPNHLYHPTAKTLGKLLDSGGWRIEKIFYQRYLENLVISLGNFLEDKGRFPKVANRLIGFTPDGGLFHRSLLPLTYILSALRQTGRMTVWARRKDD